MCSPAWQYCTGAGALSRQAGTEINLRTNRPCRLVPAHQGMKTRRSDLVQRIGAADSATPHPDPSGGQAPRLAKSSTALHYPLPHLIVGPLVVY